MVIKMQKQTSVSHNTYVNVSIFLKKKKQYNADPLSLLISKVIICTDGKANTELGNLEEEDIDARTLLSSTIFYQELGEYAANQGLVHISSSMSRIKTSVELLYR